MDLCYPQQPHCRAVSGMGLMSVPPDGGMRGSYNPYANAPWSGIAQKFSDNFNYFTAGRSGFVTIDSLSEKANRAPMRNPWDNDMTQLAKVILGIPEIATLFDSVNHGGQEDGYISQGDVSVAIDVLEAQEALSMPPVRGGQYNGAMQQHRVNQQFPPQYSGPAPRYEDPGFSSQRPSYQRAPGYGMPDDKSNSYSDLNKEDFSNRVLTRFSSLEDPGKPGYITDRSLNAVAAGHRLDGTPATEDEMNIAKALLDNGSWFREYDEGKTGELDGSFTRQDLANASNRFENMSNSELLETIKKHFVEYGDGDNYVNFKELKQAAGLVPSNKTYTPAARQAATEFLQRKELLEDTDIGVDDKGNPGYKDQRFDLDNLKYMIKKERDDERPR